MLIFFIGLILVWTWGDANNVRINKKNNIGILLHKNQILVLDIKGRMIILYINQLLTMNKKEDVKNENIFGKIKQR